MQRKVKGSGLGVKAMFSENMLLWLCGQLGKRESEKAMFQESM